MVHFFPSFFEVNGGFGPVLLGTITPGVLNNMYVNINWLSSVKLVKILFYHGLMQEL